MIIFLISYQELISTRSPVCLENAHYISVLEIERSLVQEELMWVMGNHQISLIWLSFPSLNKATMWGKEGFGPKGFSDITDFGVEKGL